LPGSDRPLDELGERRPALVRGDPGYGYGYGNEGILLTLEERKPHLGLTGGCRSQGFDRIAFSMQRSPKYGRLH
jgi:hypothetical protein